MEPFWVVQAIRVVNIYWILKNKLKEFERKKYITKISVESLEYWKKGYYSILIFTSFKYQKKYLLFIIQF